MGHRRWVGLIAELGNGNRRGEHRAKTRNLFITIIDVVLVLMKI